MGVATGLAITNGLTSRRVHVDMFFEPSVGISAKKLDKLGMDIRSFREPLHEAVKTVMIPSIKKNFVVGGRPKWEGLAPTTVKRRTKEGYGGVKPILVRSGTLKRVAGQINIWTIGREVAMVTDLPDKAWYGKVHQAGNAGSPREEVYHYPQGHRGPAVATGETIGGDGEIPARPFIMVQTSDIPRIERVFDKWLGRKIRLAGL